MKVHRLLALLLSVLLLLGLTTACQGGTTTDDGGTTGTTADDGDTSGATVSAEEYDALVEAGHMGTVTYSGYTVENYPITDAIRGSGALSLPLVTEPTTLSVFCQFSNSYLSSPAELLCYQVIEENTGVSVDWQTYTEADQFSIFIASGLYTDIISVAKTTYTGGIDKAIEEEIYVPANNYFDYTPNFNALLACDDSIDIQSKTDAGNYFFSCIQTGNEPAWAGPMVRTDWLNDLGLDTPVTYDDWYEMLTLFNSEKGAEGMLISSTGYDSLAFGLISGYDTCATFYAKDGTEARYGFLDEGMRDYVAMMQKWYAEGLIQKDFVSMNLWVNATELFTQDRCGAFEYQSYTAKSSLEATYAGDTDQIDAVPLPSRTEEQQGSLHFRRFNYIIGDSCSFITTAAVERGTDVLAAQWLDYQYSQDGFAIGNYGKEGVSYEIGEDGFPHFTDYVLNPSGEMADYTVTEVRDMCQSKAGGRFYTWMQGYDLYAPEVCAAYEIWADSATGDWIMPGITMTTAESETYTAVYGDIATYADEMILRFITGDADMSEWDTFVSELEKMGIQTAIDVYQDALDRYNAR